VRQIDFYNAFRNRSGVGENLLGSFMVFPFVPDLRNSK
jgi:hypothetical protein